MDQSDDPILALLKMLSDQVSDLSLRFDSLRLTLEGRDETLHEGYERKLQALRLVSQMQRDLKTNDLLKQIETERRRKILDSHEGKPQ
jgi:hypothetical protein